ncbi:mucin-3A-like isoform X1 [Scomber scombrus]|uniref:Mucin-3A-like isoform X1 n=1 Tax=Scomber scombrus TaxID=13677 RepID=A0AAV1PGY2_SCOSC
MADEETAQIHEADEGRENIPPGAIAAAGTSKPKVQGLDVEGYSSTPPFGENKPLSDMHTFATPARSKSGVISPIIGLQSTLTPTLKCWYDIYRINEKLAGKKRPSAEPLKHGNNPRQSFFPSGNATANCQKSTRSTSQHPNSDFSSSHSGRSVAATDTRAHWLDEEYFPEITLLDVTSESSMELTSNGLVPPGSVPVTPVSARELVRKPEQVADMNPNSKMSSTLTSKWEISSFLLPGGEISSLEVTQDISHVDSLKNSKLSSELSGQIMAETGRLERIQISSEELSSTLNGNTISSFSEQSDKCAGENAVKPFLEVTRDISMDSVFENSRPSLELSGQNVGKIQTPVEDTLDPHPANDTRDINSSGDMSAQCAASQISTSDMQCNTSSKNVTCDLPVDPVEENDDELLTSHETALSSKVVQPIIKTAGSVNSTFTTLQLSLLSASTDLNTTAQMSYLQNKTLDLPLSNVSSPTAQSEATGQAGSVSKNTPKPSCDMNQYCASANASDSSDVRNATFDRHSLQKSSGNTILGEAAAATTFCLQNNTFDSKPLPKQNGTITLSETSSSDSHQNTLDKSCPPEVCNTTTSPKDKKSEVHSPELSNHSGTPASTDTNAKMVDPAESTFEVDPAVEAASGAGPCETEDHSSSGLPMADGFSDSLGHQSMHLDNNKANAFNLDDTLDLKSDYLITSTPMTNCKTVNFNVERDEGKAKAAQKKLYRDGPSKPVGQVPSNIVCDRKTFLRQPAVKSLLPNTKASQLLKYKPASLLPGRFEPSGLLMTRQRTQVEALRNTAASDTPREASGVSSSYNLRAATTGSKLPNSALRKTHMGGIQSGIQRSAPGLRPPSTRSNTLASSSADKLRGPTATIPVTKSSQTKKHLLTRGEPLPTAKKKKTDAPLSSGCAESSTSSNAANRSKYLKPPTTGQRALPSKTQRDDAAVPASTAENSTSCDAASGAKNLKRPVTSQRVMLAKTQGHGCANCIVLEQQIQRLKEELLQYKKQEEEC